MTQLGKYQLHEELGRGGYGTVYRATDTALKVERAVKVLHPAMVADHEFIKRFEREARFAARLEHPNIVPVYDLGEDHGRFYLVMKYMPGRSLKDRLAGKKRLSLERTLETAREMASALDYAHGQGLIHRDIKPANILFDQNMQAYLSDLGFAKVHSEISSESLSSSGGIVGTSSYIAPEIWDGATASPASDLYSLACVVYEMLTGYVLFAGKSPAEIITRHIVHGPAFPPGWSDNIPVGFTPILRKALSKNPDDRFDNASGFIEQLEKQAFANLEEVSGRPLQDVTLQTAFERLSALYEDIVDWGKGLSYDPNFLFVAEKLDSAGIPSSAVGFIAIIGFLILCFCCSCTLIYISLIKGN